MLPPYINQYQALLDERSEIMNLKTYLEIMSDKSLGEVKVYYGAAASNLNAAVTLINEEIKVVEMRNQLAQIQSPYQDPNKLPFLE